MPQTRDEALVQREESIDETVEYPVVVAIAADESRWSFDDFDEGIIEKRHCIATPRDANRYENGRLCGFAERQRRGPGLQAAKGSQNDFAAGRVQDATY